MHNIGVVGVSYVKETTHINKHDAGSCRAFKDQDPLEQIKPRELNAKRLISRSA